MANAKTAIEWTDRTWNPTTGCTKVSPACAHCYIERTPPFRIHGRRFVRGSTDLQLHYDRLEAPLYWRKPARIFVNSLSDLFHEAVPDGFIADVWATMAWARWHTVQILTKRPDRMRALLTSDAFRDKVDLRVGLLLEDSKRPAALRFDPLARRTDDARACMPDVLDGDWPLPNVWLGVSAENQRMADLRIPLLLQTPAAIRFISYEPALGPLNVKDFLPRPMFYCPQCGKEKLRPRCEPCGTEDNSATNQLIGLDWVIAGGESGPKARPAHPDWFRSVRDQCQAAGVPFFFKQWGEWRPIDQGGSDWYADFYRSNRTAKESENQGNLDEAFGRYCTVETTCMHRDGTTSSLTEPGAWLQGTGAMQLFMVGKRAAGRELDGRTWDEFPSAVSA